MAWPRATGPFCLAPGPLAHWPGSLALIGSFAHWLVGTGLASFAWPHLFIASRLLGAGLICSLAPWRWPPWLICSWLIGSLARPHFLAFLELFCSGLKLLGAHCTICSFCSLAHLGLFGSSAQWLICSLAHLCLFWHLSSSFGSGLIFGLSRAFLLQPQDLSVSGLFNLKLLVLELRFFSKEVLFYGTFQLINTSFL